MPDCAACGESNCIGDCHQALSVQLADDVADNPEHAELAALRIELRTLRDELRVLSVEVHQHWP
jgi:hypothetical protein